MAQQYVVMKMGKELYGAPVMQVVSVERMMDITPVPRTLPFIKGVVNLRGTVTPVIDLRERVGLSATERLDSDAMRIVIVEVDAMLVGMIVDSVEDVVTVDESQVSAPPEVVGGLRAVYLHGVAQLDERLLVLLNVNRILSDVEVDQLREVEKRVHG
ncbi:chemotaxis protein CheW [Alicyclobacillus hesperidum subsp. aegles]|uniref:chemotaxis protein CheW n=1 Tax=Alicyclobacillus hesperidum TaxID=89784 RepID=UPI0007192401|nr:chemotaxis protein CheW [Alicyclobacillus hesperidum]KRW91646.1 chemotaxis protein CheW [Alicyclobacillus tengchongensis]GLG00583.1 chemotaxis protein CheW [Alicyclobacillus hesperidum subsp. aegles]